MSSGHVAGWVNRIRIVSPLTRAREDATIHDVQAKDIIEILDQPVYTVDPKTYESTTTLQRFLVGDNGSSLSPVPR
jgi:hypothetical protein